jgi:hypothetical protein
MAPEYTVRAAEPSAVGIQAWDEGFILSAMSERRISRSAIELIADNRIRQAMEEGQFDDLPGLGKPIPDIDEPYDPLWWVKKWMKREKLGAEIAQGLKNLRERG